MKHYLKFTGERKRLIPLGFKFFRYYAANYIGYSLNFKGKEYSQICMIWIAKPSDVHLHDLNSEESVFLYKYIMEGKERFRGTHKAVPGFFSASDYHKFTIDKVLGKMIPYDITKHDGGMAACWTGTDLSGEFDQEIYKKTVERFHVVYLSHDWYLELVELMKENLFTIAKWPKDLGE